MIHAPPPAASEVSQPEWRAAVFAGTIRYTAHLTGPVRPYALRKHLFGWLDLPEEVCGYNIIRVIFMMVRCGLFESNTTDLAKGEAWLGGDTRLTASPMLTSFLYDEEPAEPEDDESDG